jgi:lysophospholipase L1-like esterase
MLGLGIDLTSAVRRPLTSGVVLPVIALATASVSQSEAVSNFVFTLSRTGDTSGASSVNWAVTGSSGNPANAADFVGGVLPSGTINFAAGDTSKTITVQVANDSTVEPNEGFTVTLSSPTGASLGTATATGTIVNDDSAPLPVIAMSTASVSQSEATTNFVYTVSRSGDTSGASSVAWAVTGSGTNPANAADFVGGVLPSGTLNFAAGDTSKTITVQVSNDATVEPDETFTLTLSAPSGATLGTATGAGTIVNDDSAPALSPYLGQVATRSAQPSTTLAQTKMMSRVAMFATEDLSSYQLKFGAWQTTGGGEVTTGIGSAVTYTASIEYPAGTFTQIKWGGSASVVAPLGGDTGLCDAITTAVPKGAKFFVRVYATTTAAGIPVCNQSPWNSGGDAAVIDGTATDLTMSGTVTGANVQGIFPLCVVQMTTQPTFLFLGDSRTASGGSPGQDANGNGGQFAYGLGTSYGYINAAQSSALASQSLGPGSTRRNALAQYVSHVFNGFGINDIITGGRTLAQLQSLMLILAYQIPGKRHIIATTSPNTTGTYADLAGQTVNANDAIRIAFNNWARSLPDPYFACVDIASATESTTAPGKWNPGMTNDGLHQNPTGSAAIVSAGVLNAPALASNPGLLRFSPYEFTPSDWYDAQDNYHATISPGRSVDGVTIWSGTGPYGATSFNGGPGFAFTTVGAYWYRQTLLTVSRNAPGLMLGILWTPSQNPAANAGLCGFCTGVNNSSARAMIMQDSSGRPGLAIRRLDADAVVTVFGSTALTVGSPYLLVAQFDVAAGVAYLYVNGVLACSGDYASGGATSDVASFEGHIGFLGGKGAYGTAGEFVAFNTASASDAVRQKLEGDMAWRRGAAATFLPAGHPYLSVRPGP